MPIVIVVAAVQWRLVIISALFRSTQLQNTCRTPATRRPPPGVCLMPRLCALQSGRDAGDPLWIRDQSPERRDDGSLQGRQSAAPVSSGDGKGVITGHSREGEELQETEVSRGGVSRLSCAVRGMHLRPTGGGGDGGSGYTVGGTAWVRIPSLPPLLLIL